MAHAAGDGTRVSARRLVQVHNPHQDLLRHAARVELSLAYVDYATNPTPRSRARFQWATLAWRSLNLRQEG
jgi:hypothetical protein